jgi:HEXXH motif-containing protein
MNDLADEIRQTLLSGDSHELWWPHLTPKLVAARVAETPNNALISLEKYSTAGFLSGGSATPAATFEVAASDSTPLILRIELLPPEIETEFRAKGVEFCNSTEINDALCLTTLAEALALISKVPTLAASVGTLVRSVHILRTEDPNYDVSFSEPQLPFSIFVSMAMEHSPNAAMRVAEAIIHEAMHLQLSLVERSILLVMDSAPNLYSPWKQELRSATGILHATYVFAAIIAWTSKQTDNHFLFNRANSIKMQARQMDFALTSSALTSDGRKLLEQLNLSF